MKKYYLEYRPFLLFVAKFFVSYLFLALIYQGYLSKYNAKKLEVDSFTQLVSDQTVVTCSFFDSDVYQVPNAKEASTNIIYKGKFIARILEGCNSLSVMILFVAFLIAFKGSLKNTLWFAATGVLIIHLFNILRIALLVVAIYHYPESTNLLHDIIFPLFIYGTVFLLWLVWVNKFSFYASNTTSK